MGPAEVLTAHLCVNSRDPDESGYPYASEDGLADRDALAGSIVETGHLPIGAGLCLVRGNRIWNDSEARIFDPERVARTFDDIADLPAFIDSVALFAEQQSRQEASIQDHDRIILRTVSKARMSLSGSDRNGRPYSRKLVLDKKAFLTELFEVSRRATELIRAIAARVADLRGPAEAFERANGLARWEASSARIGRAADGAPPPAESRGAI